FLVPEARKRRSFTVVFVKSCRAENNYILHSTSWRQKERHCPWVTVARLEEASARTARPIIGLVAF
ncbi:MAG: hypothetical protein QGH07_13785, partial [Alphaproteobacteria bacterium]|nr:hypothetical protein [Alphaproteobacteria bacterium]